MQIDFHASPARQPGRGDGARARRPARPASCSAPPARSSPSMGEGHPGGEHPKAKHELLESTIEIITGVCRTVAEARADLAGTLAEVDGLLAPRGLAAMCSGTHPFSDWAEQQISPNPRYAQAGRGDAVAGPPAPDLRRPRARRACARPRRRSPSPTPCAGYIPHFLAPVGVEPLLEGQRHRAGVEPLQGVRGPAHRRAALPARAAGPSSSSS